MTVTPTRQTAVKALEAHRRDLLLQNKPDEAAQVSHDLALIRKGPGEDLYAMSRLCRERADKLGNSRLARDVAMGWPSGPLGLALGVGGGLAGGAAGIALGLALVTWVGAPELIGVGLGLGGVIAGMSAGFLPNYVKARADRYAETVQAIDRQYQTVANYQPSPGGQVPMSDFSKVARLREDALLRQGLLSKAGELRLVYESLEGLNAPTLEDAFSEMCRRHEDGPDKASWERVMNVVTRGTEVTGVIQSMAEISQLASNPKGSIEVTPDTIRVGSVVLKRRPQAA